MPDLDAAERFVCGVLGERPVLDGGTIDDTAVMARALGGGTACRYRFRRLGTGPNLEVFECDGGGRVACPGSREQGGHHVALYVGEIDPAAAHLTAHGVAVSGPPERILEGPAAGAPPRSTSTHPGASGWTS